MRINKSRHHHSPSGIYDTAASSDDVLNFTASAYSLNPAGVYEHCAIFDDRQLTQLTAGARTMRAGKRDKLRAVDYRERIRQVLP